VTRPASPPDWAREYLRQGWCPIPVPYRQKRPVLDGWQRLRLSEADLAAHFNGQPQNIGVLTGEPSGGLADADLDALEVLALAPMFLPETDRRFGRRSKRESHRLYYAEPCPPGTERFESPGDGCFVELRSTGSQTLFPGSVHPSGEPIEWDAEGPVPQVDGLKLRQAVRHLAIAALLARHWPAAGLRHWAALAAAGFLLRRGLAEEQTTAIIVGAARQAGDEQWQERAADVGTTALKLAAGEAATGGPRLAECLAGDGARVVHTLERWLPGAPLRTATNKNPWEPPLPLTGGARVPPFPMAVLPAWLKRYVMALATALQVPEDLPAMLSLSVIAVAVARKAEVRVQDGWNEPLNIFTVTVLPPGEGKSPVFADVVAPLESWEATEAARMSPSIREAETRHAILEARAKHAKERAAKASAQERAALEEEAQEAARELAECVVPVPPRLIADDVTPERLASMLHEQAGRMAVMSPEGGIFELLAGRYSTTGAPNLDAFLKGHVGDNLRVDRGTRPADRVKRPALTVGLTVQPDVLRRLRGIPEFRGRGLLARFLYAVPTSRLGTRDTAAPPVPASVRAEYLHRIRTLLDCIPLPAEADTGPTPIMLRLSAEAVARFRAFRGWLEPQLSTGGALAVVADWAAKLPGHVARLAGLLHLADSRPESIVGPGADGLVIPVTAMDGACTLAEYLIHHAKVAFRAMEQDAAFTGAIRVLAWLRASRRDSFTRRACHRELQGTFPRVADLALALGLLLEYGYLREQHLEPPGKRPSLMYLVNPSLYDNVDNLDNQPPVAAPRRPGCRGCQGCH
jgi:replicative DNA helicase